MAFARLFSTYEDIAIYSQLNAMQVIMTVGYLRNFTVIMMLGHFFSLCVLLLLRAENRQFRQVGIAGNK